MKTIEKNIQEFKLIRQIAIILFIFYFLLAGLFYYLAGDELHLRKSRGNIDLPIATSGAVELIKGNSVEQEFVSKIELLQGVSVQMGTYMRHNTGSVNFELADTETGQILLNKSIDVESISEGEKIDLAIGRDIEGTYNHKLKLSIYSEDCVSGNAVSPLINSNEKKSDLQLYFNKQPVNGILCFAAYGKDRVWTGTYYKQIVVSGACILACIILIISVRVKANRKSYILNSLYAVNKYKFLIQQLVSRDFKTKYKRSILGIFWSFLNPLFMMGVQYFIFSTIFKSDIPYYHIYLLIGVVMFNYFSEACSMALASIIGNAGLITKVYIPKYIYPLSRILSSTVNLAMSLLPLIGAMIISGVPFSKSFLLLPFALICLVIFCLGLGMLLSASMVYFRDTQFLWGVISMLWMYATPIFYPENILPEQFKFVLDYNPIYYFIKFARICILQGVSPEPVLYIQCFLFSSVMLLVGAVIFKKSQDRFILNL
ncbi:hypothetical protein CCS79_14600 [Clostridium diolis]|uniref:ABC transporter permease n=1 Tax=Clostridium diolis TaxID=223919 RepID=UPI000B3FE8FD|nr:ABC transporter permease [Clostridium diolis]OVE67347.1 hypothetical protein CCS79_14600 [Clostridium diolis]